MVIIDACRWWSISQTCGQLQWEEMEGKTLLLTVGCEIYCLVLHGSLCWKVPSCFLFAFTPLNPCLDFKPRGQRIGKTLSCITGFVPTLLESLKLPQKGLGVGHFHAYGFSNPSSLEFFSATSLMDITLLCWLIGILLWVADAAVELEGANILSIWEEPLEKGRLLSDFIQVMKNDSSISLTDNSNLQMCCTGF